MPESDLVAVHHGYECRYYPTVMSGPVVRWTLPGGDGRWEVSASRDGVVLQGGSPAHLPDGPLRRGVRLPGPGFPRRGEVAVETLYLVQAVLFGVYAVLMLTFVALRRRRR